MEIEKIVTKMERENKKLAKLMEKRDALNKEIEEQNRIVETLKKQEKEAKLSQFSLIAEKKGISVDELLEAISNSDMFCIQEKLEEKLEETSKWMGTAIFCSEHPFQ